jgi:3-hydroxyacyl-[acyl-carrier-protein] dehydratase
MAAGPHIPPERWNLERTLFDLEAIRTTNLQRFEMEQLTAVTHMDQEAGEVVGYVDIPEDPFWARGHIPGRPLMPGVLMIEALAQLTAFYAAKHYDDDRFIGMGGVDGAKFRRTVVPGTRFVMVALAVKVRPRGATFDCQGWVDGKLCVEARIAGIHV